MLRSPSEPSPPVQPPEVSPPRTPTMSPSPPSDPLSSPPPPPLQERLKDRYKDPVVLKFTENTFQLGNTTNEAFKLFENSDCVFYDFSVGQMDFNANVCGLNDMPNDIIEKILKELDWEERFTLRKVCQRLRRIVDSTENQCSKLYLEIYETHSELHFNNQTVEYHYAFNGLLVISGDKYKHMEKVDHWKLALNDMVLALRNPKIEVKNLYFEFNLFLPRMKKEHIVDTTRAALSLIGHRVHANYLKSKIKDQEELLAILPYLEPGALEYIQIQCAKRKGEEGCYVEIDEIVELDQWKQAKIVKSDGISCDVEHLAHFRSIDVLLFPVQIRDVLALKNALFKSRDFESCHLSFFEKTINIEQLELEMGTDPIPIPGTNKHFVIEYGKNHVTFTKAKRRLSI